MAEPWHATLSWDNRVKVRYVASGAFRTDRQMIVAGGAIAW